MKELYNDSLELALNDINKKQSKDNFDKLIKALLGSYLISPVKLSNQHRYVQGESNLDSGEHFEFRTIKSKDNSKVILAFTNSDELFKWSNKEFEETLICELDDYLKVIIDHGGEYEGFLINLFSQQVFIDLDIIKYILKHYEFNKNMSLSTNLMRFHEPIEVIEPIDYPQDFIYESTIFIRKNRNIKSAYIQMVKRRNDLKYAIVLEFKDSGSDNTYKMLDSIASKYLLYYPYEIYTASSEFGAKVILDSEPYFKRKLFWL